MNPLKRVALQVSIRKMIGISAVSLLILIGITGYGFLKQNETQETARWVLHTQKVIAELQQLEAIVYQSVTAQRGFVITGQSRYEDLFNKNDVRLKETLNSVAKLTIDNDVQQVNLARIRRPLGELQDFYKLTFAFVKNKQTEKAVGLITSGKGQSLIDEIKIEIISLIEHEKKLLAKRLTENEDAQLQTNSIIFTSSSLAIAFIMIVLLLMYREFTRRLKVQQDLARASEFQEAVLKATPFALITADTNGRTTLFNPAAEILIGYDAQEVLGAPVANWHVPEEIVFWSQKLSERFGTEVALSETLTYLASKDITESSNWTFIKKDRSTVKVSLTISALRNSEDEIYGYIAVAYDITKQLDYEKNIIEAREQALSGTRAKSEFLANMSHEIRTPMNAILGMAELLMESDLDEEQKKYVEIFQRAGDSLLNIINDILDLSKIEAGQFELDLIPLKLTNIVQKSIEIIALKAHQKGIKVVVDIDKRLGNFYIGDPHRIRQILLNLLGNSIKFTKEGEIVLRLKGRALSEKIREVTFEVQDTGIGMSESNVKRLFQRFAQADSSITKEFGGTGLGLSITKRLCELMKGKISVQSTPGSGSTFTVTVQLEIDDAPLITNEPHIVAAPNEAAEPMVSEAANTDYSLRILLVDDNDENRLVIRSFLKSKPWKIDEARNGQEAVEKFRHEAYDIVFMDMQMPIMDGYTATREIRRYETESNLEGRPILALTAYALKEEVDKSYAAGCNGHLSKPISKKTLLKAIEDFASELRVVVDKDLADLIPAYLAGRETELRNLKTALSEENYSMIHSLGHKLRGSAGSYGFAGLTVIGQNLEEHAKVQGQAEIEKALTQYQTYLKKVKVIY